MRCFKINSYLTLLLEINYIKTKSATIRYNQQKLITHDFITNYRVFFIEQNNKNKFSNFKIFQLFTASYLKNIYNINIFEKNINAINILPNKLSKNFLYKVRNVNFKQFNIKYFNEVGYLFLVNIWLKNIKNICKYIKKTLDNIHFKKHRLYFLFFFKILNKYIKPNYNQLQIKGLYLVFRGKLGKGGNARKKVMFYKNGYYSLSNKMLCLNTQKWDIWTKTGTVGCTMRLFYKKYDNLFKFLFNYLFIYTYKIKLYFIKSCIFSKFPKFNIIFNNIYIKI